MKATIIGSLVLAVHVLAVAGFGLMQGCTTGNKPVPWVNMPFSKPRDQIIMPVEDIQPIDSMPPPATVDYAPSTGYSMPPPIQSSDYSAPALPALSAGQTYVVRKGDTLSKIGSAYGVSWKTLAEYNKLGNPDRLLVGQELRVPSTASSYSAPQPVRRPSAPAPKAAAAPVSQGGTYVIQRGDTLSGIAKRAGVSVAEIREANALSGNLIIAGKSITIPRKGTVKPVETRPAPVPAEKTAPVPEPAPVSAIELKPAAPALVYDHVLYPGETLETVARQYGVSKSDIMELNGITDPESVKSGTKLLVPIPE